jgi:hypothetical protein
MGSADKEKLQVWEGVERRSSVPSDVQERRKSTKNTQFKPPNKSISFVLPKSSIFSLAAVYAVF